MSTLTIGDVAERAGIRASAIRYYESIGILPEPLRISGQRRYGAEVFTRLGVIRLAQDSGFTMAEIGELLNGFDAAVAPSKRWRGLAERKAAEIDAQLQRLQAMRQVLESGLTCTCLTWEQCAGVGCEPPIINLTTTDARR